MKMFRSLESQEEQEFRKWARDNYKPFDPIKGIWHPIVQEECVKMNKEAAEYPHEGLDNAKTI
jgi:hypothetical protein